MILLCGIPSEPPLQLAIEAAVETGIPHVVVNQRESRFYELALGVGTGGAAGTLRVRGEDWDLEAFSGVYVRLTDVATLPEHRPTGRRPPDPERLERARTFHDGLLEWIEFTRARVANRPSAMGSNVSKPYQSQLIARCGFAVPDTLVTNDPDEAAAFARRHGDVVYKSTSSVRSIVRRLTPERLRQLDRVRDLPTQFQAYVPGVDVRVHVAGSALFATEARTEAVDYRYAAREGLDVAMSPIELPADIACRCRDLSTALRLPLCGIDLRRDPHGGWVCFEVNPSPAYSWYQESTGQPIAAALVTWLAGRDG